MAVLLGFLKWFSYDSVSHTMKQKLTCNICFSFDQHAMRDTLSLPNNVSKVKRCGIKDFFAALVCVRTQNVRAFQVAISFRL